MEGGELIARLEIESFIDSDETTPGYLADDTIALVEYMIVDKQSGERTDPWRRYRSLQGLTAAETEFCLCQVCCTAVNTVERRRNHIPAFLPQDDEKVAC